MSRKSVKFLIVLIFIVLIPSVIGFMNLSRIGKGFMNMIGGDADVYARNYIDLLYKGEIEKADSLLNPSIRDGSSPAKLRELNGYLNSDELKDIQLVGVHVSKTLDSERYDLSYQLEYKSSWILVSMVLNRQDNSYAIHGFHMEMLPTSLKEMNRFTLLGKPAVNYILLLAILIVGSFSFVTASICFDTPIKKKWLWIFFILIGFVQINLNWTNGSIWFKLLHFNIPVFSVSKGGYYAPLILSVSFPLGAMLFWLKRKKLLSAKAIDESSDAIEATDEGSDSTTVQNDLRNSPEDFQP